MEKIRELLLFPRDSSHPPSERLLFLKATFITQSSGGYLGFLLASLISGARAHTHIESVCVRPMTSVVNPSYLFLPYGLCFKEGEREKRIYPAQSLERSRSGLGDGFTDINTYGGSAT